MEKSKLTIGVYILLLLVVALCSKIIGRMVLAGGGKYTVFIPLIISTLIEGHLFLQISKATLSYRAKKITKYIGIYLLVGSAIAVPLVLIKWLLGI